MKAKRSTPICPICSAPAHRQNTVYGIRYWHCNLWSWDGYPLADSETHALRKKVHKLFDPLWQSNKMTRTEAYRCLARSLKIPYRKCHMKMMGKETLKKVLLLIKKHKEKKDAKN